MGKPKERGYLEDLGVDGRMATWHVVQGLARSLRPHSHCKASRAEQNRKEPNRFDLENKPMLWN